MARVLFFAFMIGVTLYALIDWALNSKEMTPGGLSRWLWLAVIVFFPVVGPATWIILRLVGKAEARQRPPRIERPTRLGAPDDDPEFLDDWAEKIKRRQKRSRPGRAPEDPQTPNGEQLDPDDPDDPRNLDDR